MNSAKVNLSKKKRNMAVKSTTTRTKMMDLKMMMKTIFSISGKPR